MYVYTHVCKYANFKKSVICNSLSMIKHYMTYSYKNTYLRMFDKYKRLF